MLTAYWDLELKIKDLPTDDPRVPTFPLESRDLAESILAKAKIARPECGSSADPEERPARATRVMVVERQHA